MCEGYGAASNSPRDNSRPAHLQPTHSRSGAWHEVVVGLSKAQMASEVYCHPCAMRQQGQLSTSGDLVCCVCGSDFCEVVERQVVDQPAQRSNGNVFMSSFSMPGAPGVGGADAPRTQVMIIQETVSLDQLLGGRAGGLNMGDYASNEQLERIMTQLLQGYAPRHRPTAQAFIDKLPRLQVAPAADSADGTTTAGRDLQQQQGEGGQADSIAAGAPAVARFACCAAGDACPVCHDAYKDSESVVELPCQHCYHETCILPWLKEHNDCPVCRRKFDSEDAQAPTTASTTAADTGAGAGTGAYTGDPPAMDPMFRLLAQAQRRQGARTQPGGAVAPEAVTADPLAGLTPQQRQQREQMREQTRQRVSARHAARLSQHRRLEARLGELQESSRRQLAELLQGQAADSAAPGGAVESRAATPLAEMAGRLRDAQRDVEDSQRRLRALEAQLERLADPNAYFNPNLYVSDVAPVLSPAWLEGMPRPMRARVQTPAQAASAAAAAAAVNAAAALRERAAGAARQQDEAPRSEADQQRDEAARRARERRREDALNPESEQEHGQETWQRQPQPQRARVQRRGASRSPSSSGSDARPRGMQPVQAIAGIVAVDAALGLPSFFLSMAEPRPVPLDAFMQPLSTDDSNGAPRRPPASMAAAAAAHTSAPSATLASSAAGTVSTPAPVAGAAAAPASATSAAAGAAGAAAVVPQEPELRAVMPARQTRSWPVAMVAGALTLPWRILGGMLGLLYSVGGRR